MRKFFIAVTVAGLLSAVSGLIGAPEKRIDLATVVSKTEAELTLAEPVKDPQQRNSDGSDGYYTRCNYYSQDPGRSLILRVRQAAPGQLEPTQQLMQMGAENNKIQPLPGLGDKAAILSEGGSNGVPRVVLLYVAQSNALITVGIGGLDDEKTAVEKAKTLARKILAQL